MGKEIDTNVNLSRFCNLLNELGGKGQVAKGSEGEELLTSLRLATKSNRLVATNRLFSLGPVNREIHIARRALSLHKPFRHWLLQVIIGAVKSLRDDESVADTLECLDHLGPELLAAASRNETSGKAHHWAIELWQSPDAITLLSKLVERPNDVAAYDDIPIAAIGFDWLDWATAPECPAPAPWVDGEPLGKAVDSVRHPFWGALICTLDACTGDYEWQSLVIRNGRLRSQYRTVGKAEPVIESLWRSELGLYPVPPLVVPDDIPFVPGKPLHWLQRSLDKLAEAGIATELEGSWRLTDDFRKQLMIDDEHMMAFEAVRQRSYRLASAATKLNNVPDEVAAQ